MVQVFRRRVGARVVFRAGIAPDFRAPVEQAIKGGRYLIFGGVDEGTATLLLSCTPRLVAVVRKTPDEPGTIPSFDVESVREAGPDIDREREELSQL